MPASVFATASTTLPPQLALGVNLRRRLLKVLLKLVLTEPSKRYVKGYAIDGPYAKHCRHTPKQHDS